MTSGSFVALGPYGAPDEPPIMDMRLRLTLMHHLPPRMRQCHGAEA